jgi:hypothetical protein
MKLRYQNSEARNNNRSKKGVQIQKSEQLKNKFRSQKSDKKKKMKTSGIKSQTKKKSQNEEVRNQKSKFILQNS